jgi:hypothetical protein
VDGPDVTAYAQSLVELIDSRIDQATPKVAKMGTVTGRDLWAYSGPLPSRALVVFDGSAGVAQPVKCPESVVVHVGDRVGLVRFESDWIITINYSLQTLCNAMNRFTWASLLTTTSTSFVDMPNSPTVEFVKERDATFLRVYMSVSLYATGTPSQIFHIGMHLDSADGSVSYDEDIVGSTINVASVHAEWAGWVTTGALPAMSYVGTARWFKSGAGTMTLTVDSNDTVKMHVIEVVS